MRVGVVGATGAVGRELVEVLGKRRFPVTELRLFASAHSAGARLPTPWGETAVEAFDPYEAGGLDLALLRRLGRLRAGAGPGAGGAGL